MSQGPAPSLHRTLLRTAKSSTGDQGRKHRVTSTANTGHRNCPRDSLGSGRAGAPPRAAHWHAHVEHNRVTRGDTTGEERGAMPSHMLKSSPFARVSVRPYLAGCDGAINDITSCTNAGPRLVRQYALRVAGACETDARNERSKWEIGGFTHKHTQPPVQSADNRQERRRD